MKKKKTKEEIVNNEEIITQNLKEKSQINEDLETENITETALDEEKKDVQEETELNSKQSETVFSKRIEIPLVGLIITILIFIIIIISLIIFKDKIFGFNFF